MTTSDDNTNPNPPIRGDTVSTNEEQMARRQPLRAELDEAAHLPPGTIIAGRYRLERLLGEGGMGAVYEATQLGLKRLVAIKLMHGAFAFEARPRERFIREARVASRLKHPAAVEIYDFGHDVAGLFLVMERLQGYTLADFLDVGMPSVADVLTVLRNMALGLEAAHAMGLVHRDLKPENVFLVDKKPAAVKLVDFGLAFIEGDSDDVGRVTKEAIVIGTPAFVAPETAQALAIGPPADMYAVGVIAFLMLSGALPFSGGPAALIAAHVYQAPPRLRDVGANVHIGIEDLVRRLLEKDPLRRPTASELVSLLDTLAAAPHERSRALMDRVRSGTEKLGVPAGVLAGRDARMLSQGDPDAFETSDYTPHRQADRRRLACSFAVAPDAVLALSVVEIDCVPVSSSHDLDPFAACDAILCRADEVEGWIEVAAAQGIALLCTVVDTAPAAMTALIRAGVDDVVIAPYEPATLAKKVSRAMAKRRRRETHRV